MFLFAHGTASLLRRLRRAQAAQSIQNKPEQRAASRSPRAEATTGTDDPLQPGQPVLRCNIAHELSRWRRTAAAQCEEVGTNPTATAYVHPWEGKVPIHAPSRARLDRPEEEGTQDPEAQSWAHRYKYVSNECDLDDRATDEGNGVRGSVRGKGISPLPSARRTSLGKASSFSRAHTDMIRPSTTGSIGGVEGSIDERKAAYRTPPRSGSSTYVGSGSSSVNSDPASAGVSFRIFDSEAAEWVNSVVVCSGTEESRSTKSLWRGARQEDVNVQFLHAANIGTELPAAPWDGGDARLTTAAREALTEVFSRFDRQRRGYLNSEEISAFQMTLGHPETRSPPSLHSRRHPQNIRKLSAPGPVAPIGLSTDREARGSGDARILTCESFFAFCRTAAVRDAIFIRHLFVRTGYNLRLEFRRDDCVTVEAGAEITSTPAASTREKKYEKDRRRKRVIHSKFGSKPGGMTTRDNRLVDSIGSHVVDNNTDKRKSVKYDHCSATMAGAYSREDGLAECEDCDTRGVATGGIIEAAHIWDWTEDSSVRGAGHDDNRAGGGLLSRGGGARFSPSVAATAAHMSGVTCEAMSRARSHLESTSDLINSSGNVRRQKHARPSTVLLSSFSSGCEEGMTKNLALPAADTAPIAAAGPTLDQGKILPAGGHGTDRGRQNIIYDAPNALHHRSAHGVPENLVRGLSAIAPATASTLAAGTKVNSEETPARVTCEWCGNVVLLSAALKGAPGAVHSVVYCDN